MKDGQDREIDYVRISITDRCNLRCVYCMPEDGVACLDHKDILTFEEIERLCKIFATLGVHRIKITGGEPLVRKDCTELVRKVSAIKGIDSVTITTNGVLLSDYMEGLVKAGLTGVNISLDSLDPMINEELTRRNYLLETMNGIAEALKYPSVKVKVNCVPMLGVNSEQLYEIVKLAKDNEIHVRFIEMMPIGMGKEYEFISESQVIEIIEKHTGKLIPYTNNLGNGPAHYYQAPGFKGKIGFISARTHKFCDSCNRIRITADGNLKTCLQYNGGYNLKALLSGLKSDDEIKEVIKEAIFNKPESHQFEDTGKIEKEESKHMSSIGG